MRIAVVDTDIANIGSVCRVLRELGADTVVARKPAELAGASRILLPGVGSFAAGMASLRRAGFDDALRQAVADGKPLLGICLGMQLLADFGSESGGSEGLGLVKGKVEHLQDTGCRERIPHMGWNDVTIERTCSLVTGIATGTDFYFVHSYVFCLANPAEIVASCDHGGKFAAIISNGNVHGAQFHPEKSAQAGFRVLDNFLKMPAC